MNRRQKKLRSNHSAEDFGLKPLASDDDLFRWFLLVYLLAKPIQSVVAVKTWRVFMENKLDNPWAILSLPERQLVAYLHEGKYTRYQNIMARSLRICMERLLREYDGSLMYLMSIVEDEAGLVKELQKLHGVGPKTAEIFMRETEEYFAERME